MADELEVKPWSFRLFGGEFVEVTAEHLQSARALLEEGWHQVSRKHRAVARLPDGMTGIEALMHGERRSEHPHPNLKGWANGMGNGSAGEHYMRCYASRDLNVCDLDIPTFAAYRKLGGSTYGWWHLTHEKRTS